MKIVFFLILLTVNLTSTGQTKNPYLALKFDKVVMYDFEGGKDSDLYIINDKGELAKSVSKQVQIDNVTARNLSQKLGDRKSYGGGTASCFDPHLGFVYYLKGNIVGHITICLDCNRLRSSLDIPAQKQGKVGQGKVAYYLADGLSRSFRQYLNELLVANIFSHQLKKANL